MGVNPGKRGAALGQGEGPPAAGCASLRKQSGVQNSGEPLERQAPLTTRMEGTGRLDRVVEAMGVGKCAVSSGLETRLLTLGHAQPLNIPERLI